MHRSSIKVGGTYRSVRRLAASLLVALLMLASFAAPLVSYRSAAAAPAPKADLIGVSGNAFPWEDHWASYGSLLDASSIGWARVEIRWNQVQPSRNSWDWGGTDWLVDSYAQRGFKELGLLTYSVEWANGGGGNGTVFGPPADLDAYENYVRAVVNRYKDRIKAWEVWNEPDVAFFWNNQDGGDPAAYLELLRRAHRAIKSADPNAIVMNGGLTGTERGANFMQRLLDLGGGTYLDAVAFHGYIANESISDEFFQNVIWPLIQRARERAGKPLWITEFGWSSGSQGGSAAGSEPLQANWLARLLPQLFRLGGVERVFVFQFKDPNNQPNYFGITRMNGTKKPAYTAISTIAGRLVGLHYQGTVDLGVDGVRAARFGGSNRTVDIIWSQTGYRSVYLQTGASSVKVWQIDGSQQTKSAGGGVQLDVNYDPVIVERSGQDAGFSGGGGCRYFGETNQSLCGAFLKFWERYGGLMIFGYPLSAPTTENGMTVQYLERSKLEYHPEWAGTDWEVVGELVGRTITAGRENEQSFRRLNGIATDANCNAYGETGHRLCFGFKNYWEANGGLWMFGFPISEEFPERNPDTGEVYTVQYFERARFEWHPEHRGTQFEILLGRLGAQLYDQRY